MAANSVTTSSSGAAPMDNILLQAATSGDATVLKNLALHDPGVLLGTTPQGNTCLHISSIYGHLDFCTDVVALNRSLLSSVNADGETPLLTALTNGHANLASYLLRCCREMKLNEEILKQDMQGCNALHHAICSGHKELALELIAAEPALSQALNNQNKSPMFIAVMRNYADIFEKLLDIPDSAHAGVYGFNALHAAVRNDNSAIAIRIMEARPGLAREEDNSHNTPVMQAMLFNKIEVLKVLLEHDRSLGYQVSALGNPLLILAASRGHVGVARELLKHCPDAPYCIASGWTMLHQAVWAGHDDFLEFVLDESQYRLRKLINMHCGLGKTALHYAVEKCNPRMVYALLRHKDIDVAALDNLGNDAVSTASNNTMTSIGNEVYMLLLKAAATASSSGAAPMDLSLLEAATCGDATLMKHLALHDPGVLLGTTPQGNNCLHISSMYGHLDFCMDVVVLNRSLLSSVNRDGETPLLAATTRGHATLASFLLGHCHDLKLSKVILKQDKRGYNALHHAIRSGHRELALELIAAEPALSQDLNKNNESPMFMAVKRNYADIFEKLLEIPDSSSAGTNGNNALHAAARNGNSAIAKRIMEARPGMAREGDNNPAQHAVNWNKVDVLRVLLEHDRSVGYAPTDPLLVTAAMRGYVDAAREVLKHCPDAPYCDATGRTCLHHAVMWDQEHFVEFVLDESQHQLRQLINMQSSDGKTALHYAVEKCNPRMVRALLYHKDIDVTGLENIAFPLTSVKTLNWNEVTMLMLKADPAYATYIYNFQKIVKDNVTEKSRMNIKSLTETYTSNTSLVAILIATITFAAAFTLPGGYSSGTGNEGLPIMGRKLAFQAFLISDTLAMCSSLAVAFVCIIARWEDLEFLLYYRSFTKKLMWFAYMATTTAFATGLYTVLAPRLLWLAIAICILSVSLPIVTKLLGEWPVLKLKYRLGRTFKSELLDMV